MARRGDYFRDDVECSRVKCWINPKILVQKYQVGEGREKRYKASYLHVGMVL
jgi:hypothetical protein